MQGDLLRVAGGGKYATSTPLPADSSSGTRSCIVEEIGGADGSVADDSKTEEESCWLAWERSKLFGVAVPLQADRPNSREMVASMANNRLIFGYLLFCFVFFGFHGANNPAAGAGVL